MSLQPLLFFPHESFDYLNKSAKIHFRLMRCKKKKKEKRDELNEMMN